MVELIILFVYFVMWVITAILLSRLGYDEPELMGAFWIIFFPIGVVQWFVKKFG